MSYTEAVLKLLWLILVETPVAISMLMVEGLFALIAVIVCCVVLDFTSAYRVRLGMYASAADWLRCSLRHVRRRIRDVKHASDVWVDPS